MYTAHTLNNTGTGSRTGRAGAAGRRLSEEALLGEEEEAVVMRRR